MVKDLERTPNFDDIVFEIRNKEYGAYRLRKKYNRNVLIAMLIGIAILSIAVITPYMNAKALENKKKRVERQVELKMENVDQPQQEAPPPPPPPPPPPETVVQVRYVAPVVVDSIKPEEIKQLMTADQAQVTVKNEDVQVVEHVQEEVKEEEAPPQIFIVVEEMPTFPGGDPALQKYIGDHVE